MKYLLFFPIFILSVSDALAGWASGFRSGSQAGESWVRAYESGQDRAMQARQERERRRTGVIDVIESKRARLVGDRLMEIQREIDISVKKP